MSIFSTNTIDIELEAIEVFKESETYMKLSNIRDLLECRYDIFDDNAILSRHTGDFYDIARSWNISLFDVNTFLKIHSIKPTQFPDTLF